MAAVCLLYSPVSTQGAEPSERKEIKVTEQVLRTYVGEYELTLERTLTITLETGSLWASRQAKRSDRCKGKRGRALDGSGRPQRELKKVK